MSKTFDEASAGVSFAELLETKLPDVAWVEPEIIPDGFTLLAGSIKTGKSALMEYLACKIGQKQPVCYFALEYSQRVLFQRFKKYAAQTSPHLRLWHQYDLADSGLSPIEFVSERIEQYRPYLVIVDTLAMVKPRTNGDYGAEYNTTLMVKKLADTYKTNLVAIHHARKSNKEMDVNPRETLLGSQGIGAAADNIVLYDRTDGRTRVRGFGRLIEDFETYLQFDDGHFSVIASDQVELEILREKSPSYTKVLLQLHSGPRTFAEVYKQANQGLSENEHGYLPKSRVSEALRKAKLDGLVKQQPRRNGLYEYIGPTGE